MPTPAVHFRVDFGGAEPIGPGKITLLEQIARGGSLSQAARDMKMSYRRAWQLLESLNGSFSERVALTAKGGRGGGGARLTPLGRALVSAYRAFDAEIQARAARRFRPILGQARPRRPARKRARVVRLTKR
jgi:molybdate transport system regulatory protein